MDIRQPCKEKKRIWKYQIMQQQKIKSLPISRCVENESLRQTTREAIRSWAFCQRFSSAGELYSSTSVCTGSTNLCAGLVGFYDEIHLVLEAVC